MTLSHTLVCALLLVVMVFAPSIILAAPDSYTRSNNKIPNIQASSPAAGGATDSNGGCVFNAPYNNHRGESWIALDPSNPSHLVGMSKFFFDPLFYLFHLGSYTSFDGGNTWSNEVIPGFDCQSAPAFTWVNNTDPNLAFDANGIVYSTMLPYSFKYNSVGSQVWGVVPDSAISVVKSTDGVLYISYGSFPSHLSPESDVWLLKSTDGGKSFTGPTLATQFRFVTAAALPNTTFRNGISYNMAVNPANGHVLLALEVQSDNGIDVQLVESTDGGQTFSAPIFVNDPATVRDGTDQFQPTVAAGPDGTVAVAFHDHRLSCPVNDPNILPADMGKGVLCFP